MHLVALLVVLDDVRVDGRALGDDIAVLQGVVWSHEQQVALKEINNSRSFRARGYNRSKNTHRINYLH